MTENIQNVKDTLFDLISLKKGKFTDGPSDKAAELLKNYDTSFSELSSLDTEKHAELCAHLIWDDGEQSVFICPKAKKMGILLDTLDHLKSSYPEIAQKVILKQREFDTKEEAESAENLIHQTLVLYVGKNADLGREMLVDLILSKPQKAASIRIFAYLDNGSNSVFTINMRSRQNEADNFCFGMLQAYVGENAHLILNEIQDFHQKTYSCLSRKVILDRDAELHWHICELGSEKTKSSTIVRLNGSGSNAQVFGLYFPNHHQSMELNTHQDHLVPHTTSNLLFKGAVKDQSKSKWTGMVYVSPGADKADGYQKDENLILSPGSHVYAQPGLEIITDDVKCSHGTTITDIDKDQIFYLCSRGISEIDAERLIIQGFFDTILNRISYEPIRTKLQEKIYQKMDQ